LLERDYNPALRQHLAGMADIARAEEEYWEREISVLDSRLVRSGKPSRSGRSSGSSAEHTIALDLAPFKGLDLALQRRVLRAMTEQLNVALDYHHVKQLLDLALADAKSGKPLPLPGGLLATRSFRELQISRKEASEPVHDYCYRLAVPG